MGESGGKVRGEERSLARSGRALEPWVQWVFATGGRGVGALPPPPARPRPRTPPPPGGEQDEARGGARAAGARVCLVRAAPSAAGWASVGTGWRGKERLCRRDGEAALGKR